MKNIGSSLVFLVTTWKWFPPTFRSTDVWIMTRKNESHPSFGLAWYNPELLMTMLDSTMYDRKLLFFNLFKNNRCQFSADGRKKSLKSANLLWNYITRIIFTYNVTTHCNVPYICTKRIKFILRIKFITTLLPTKTLLPSSGHLENIVSKSQNSELIGPLWASRFLVN